MKRFILSILIVCVVFYIIQGPTIDDERDRPKIYTAIDRRIDAEEQNLSFGDQLSRIRHFRTSVQEALNRRVPPNEYVPNKEIPSVMKQAIVATEDKRFYDHGGIDIYGVIRAMYTNMIAGQTVEGGSTITQQLVKNLFLTSKRVWTRKAEEGVLALMMEHYYTKEDILTMYVNCIYYGNEYTGIKEAAEGYFHKEPKDLSLPEAALLAGLPQAPNYYNPNEHPKAAAQRRATVLSLMREQGMISPQEAKVAGSRRLTYSVGVPK